jgi:RHS repeat-associated protein
VYGEGFDKKLVYRPDGVVLETTLVLTGWRTVVESYGYFDDGTLMSHTTRVLDTTGREVDRLDERHGFDAYGRIETVRFGSVTVGTMHYDAQGKLGTLDLPDGAKVAYRRDQATQSVNGYTQTHASGWITSADWSFDARGLLASETYGFGGRTTTRSYGHDARGFLASAVDPGHSSTYTYDAAGLPLRTIDEAGDRTFVRSATKWSVGGVDYLLDRSGRVVQRGSLRVSYGPSGQIEGAADGARAWSYVVDETGARIARRVGGRTVEAWVSGGYLDDAGFVLPVLVDNRAVGVVEHGVYKPVVTDPRGTLLGEADEPMLLPTPYGQRASHPRLARVIDFLGKGWDPDLQLSRQGVRDYDPKLGQFWQPDPLYLEALDKVAAAPVDGNLYSFAHDDPLRFADPSGLDSVGHHYVPEEVSRALSKLGLLSDEAAEVFHKTTTGWPDDVLPHQWSKAHAKYNDAVLDEAKAFARDRGITDLRKMTRAEAEAFEHYIQHQSPNVIIRGFLRFHEIVVEAAQKYKMNAEEINAIWGPMRRWLTKKGGFGSFLMEEGKNIFGKVHAGMGVMSKIPVLDIAFALWEYKDLMEKLETQYQCPVEGLEKTYPIFFQWVPRDQAPPAGINWSEVPVHDESWDMHMQHDGA